MSKKLIAGAGVVASLAVALAPLATFADTVQPSDQHTDELVVTVLPSCTFGSWQKDASSTAANTYPGGILHNGTTGGDAGAYGADTTNGKWNETAWNTANGTEPTTGTIYHEITTDTEEDSDSLDDHFTDDLASSGYGTLVGESGTTAGNSNASSHTVHRSMLAGTTTNTFASTTMWVVCNNGDGYSITAQANPLTNGTENITVRTGYGANISGYSLKSITSTATPAETNVAEAGTAMNVPAAEVAPTTETIIATHSGVSHVNGDSLNVVYGIGIASSQKADTYAGKVTYKLYKGVNGANNS